MKKTLLHYSTALCCATSMMILLSHHTAYANPQDGQVVAGNATISSSGNKLDVHQGSDKAIIDWRSFDIGVNEHTQFYQPTNNATTLNRVNNHNPSQILGKLSANGNIVLVNPNGVFFGKDSQVDVNRLIATSADIDNSDFMAGKLHFTKPSNNPNASIINHGNITAKEAGLVGLVAPNVENHGIISARLGKVELAAGDIAVVDFYGDGLMGVAVSDDVSKQLVSNSGIVNADGGRIALTAASGKNIIDNLIKADGELSAATVHEQNGHIIIAASGNNTQNPSEIHVSGHLAARAESSGTGGKVTVTGDYVAIRDDALIDVSGHSGGGTVHIGGEYQGNGVTPTASKTFIGNNAIIRSNGEGNANGGGIVVWADDRTDFHGTVEARGGQQGGNGGFVETSGKNTLNATGRVDVSSRHAAGQGGQWLLDPNNITIQDAGILTNVSASPNFNSTDDNAIVTTAAIEAALNAGTNVTVQTAAAGANTQPGNISVNNNIEKTAGGNASLTLNAHNDILINTANITSTAGTLDITLNSDTDQATTPGGLIDISDAVINTNGGNFVGGGGANPLTTPALGINDNGFRLRRSSITAGVGNINIRGKAEGTTVNRYGVITIENANLSTTSGAINIYGEVTSTASGGRGILIHGEQGASSISTDSGDISLEGISTNAASGGHGILVYRDTTIESNSGDITFDASEDMAGNDLSIVGTAGKLTRVGKAGMTGDINLTSDVLNINNTASIITGQTLTIEEKTDGTTIGLGSGAGTLSISDTELAQITAGSIVFGGTAAGSGTSGDLTINSSNDFADTNLTFRSGNDIDIAGTVNKTTGAGTVNYIFEADRNIANSNNADITATNGAINLTLNSDKDQAVVAGGKIDLTNATITTNGGNFTAGGGANPLTTQALGIDDNGVDIANSSISTGTGNISMRGRATGTANSENGVILANGTSLNSTSGSITIEGAEDSTGTSGRGVQLIGNGSAVSVSSDSGDISIDGTGTGGTGQGLLLFRDVTVESNSGDIDMTGSIDAGALHINVSANTGQPVRVGKAGMTGDITFTADDLNLNNDDVSVVTTGTLKIQEKTPGTTIGVGAGATLTVSNSELGRISAGTYEFGSNNAGALSSGDITVNTSKDFADSHVTFQSGNDITLSGNLNKATGAGTANYIFKADRDIANASGADITASSGAINVTLNSDIDQATVAGGKVALDNATITTAGGNLVIGGGANPLTTSALGTDADGVDLRRGTINTGTGSISVRGTTQGTTNVRNGVRLRENTNITTTSGTIDFYGELNGTGTTNRGIVLEGDVSPMSISTDSGNITLTSVNNSAVGTADSTVIYRDTTIESNSGNILLDSTQTPGGNIANAIIGGVGKPVRIGKAGSTGNVNITGDRLYIDSVVSLITDQTVTLQEKTAGQTIGVGAAAGSLSISDAYLSTVDAGTLVIGGTAAGSGTSGNVTVSTTRDFADTHLTFNSGNDIFIAGNLNKATGAGTANYQFKADRNILNSGGADITATTGAINLTLNADVDQATVAGGYVALADAVITTNGGNFIVGGGADPTTTATQGNNIHGLDLTRTSVNTAAGDISLRGQVTGPAGFNSGVVLVNATSLTTTSGDISIFGDSQMTGTNTRGIRVNGATSNVSVTSGSGDITINGTAASGLGTSQGVSFFQDTNIESDSGNLSISANNSAGADFESSGTAVKSVQIGKAGMTGNITLSTDSFVIDNNTSIITDQTVTIKENTAGTLIGIGSGAGALSIADAELARISAGEYIFGGGTSGAGTSGDITVNSATTLAENTTLRSGGDIALAGNLSVGANTLSLDAAKAGGNITRTGGTLTAGTLNLDAAGTTTADVNVTTALDIGNNSTATTLTGLFKGGATQAEADDITGGPGNNASYTFEGFTIRLGSVGGGGSAPATPVTTAAPEPASTPTVENSPSPIVEVSNPVPVTVAASPNTITDNTLNIPNTVEINSQTPEGGKMAFSPNKPSESSTDIIRISQDTSSSTAPNVILGGLIKVAPELSEKLQLDGEDTLFD